MKERNQVMPKEDNMSARLNKLVWRASRFLFTITILLSLLFIVPAAQAQTFTATFSIDSASVDKFGVITVNVTLTCSELVVFPGLNSIFVNVTQPIRRIYSITGEGSSPSFAECNGATQYAIQVVPQTGRFGPGIVYINAGIPICDVNFNCVSADATLNTRIH